MLDAPTLRGIKWARQEPMKFASTIEAIRSGLDRSIAECNWRGVDVELDTIAELAVNGLIFGHDDDVSALAGIVGNAYAKLLDQSELFEEATSVWSAAKLRGLGIVLGTARRNRRTLAPFHAIVRDAEVTEVIGDLVQNHPEGLTNKQIAQLAGCHEATASRSLRVLVATGKATFTRKGRFRVNVPCRPGTAGSVDNQLSEALGHGDLEEKIAELTKSHEVLAQNQVDLQKNQETLLARQLIESRRLTKVENQSIQTFGMVFANFWVPNDNEKFLQSAVFGQKDKMSRAIAKSNLITSVGVH